MKLTKEVESMIVEAYQDDVNIFDARIPPSIKMGEATLHRKTIIEYAPENVVTKAYKNLAMEVIGNE